MNLAKAFLLAASMLGSAAYAASDQLATGPAPDWVKPVAIPPLTDERGEAPVEILLADQQTRLEPGRVTTYADVALLIQTPQGLAAGNLSFPWDPETDDITVHKLVIHRGKDVIDVLAEGQTFTIVRREPNLESAMLDGMLTANIQPEGLQVGDVLEYAMTMSSSDPVLKGHVEQGGAAWNDIPFGRAHLSVDWPSDMAVRWRQTGDLPQIKPVQSGGRTRVELRLDDLEPAIPPRFAPDRYNLGRTVEFSDFASWADVGAIMAPLYAEAAVVPAEGPLRAEVEKIKAASDDPVARAEAALALVQDRVRYVALLMGTGGYVPASAQETWARRYGDCKAKTALMLAILHELGIEAEPVAVNALSGDGIDERLPMIGLFNHVIVRAHVGGRAYWLDGTRTGDSSLARIQTPFFSWGLPLVAQDAALVRMVPEPLDKPEREFLVTVDASRGLALPAPTKATLIFRNDSALGTRIGLAKLTAQQRDEVLRRLWKDQYDDLEVSSVNARYDEATGEEILTAEGVTNLDWDDGWFYPVGVALAYDADFSRAPGSRQDAPFANGYPYYARTHYALTLPPEFPARLEMDSLAVDETVAGTAYRRTLDLDGRVLTIEATTRALSPEFPANEAPEAQKALRAISDRTVALRKPAGYSLTNAELAAALKEDPTTANGFIDRGHELYKKGRNAEAVADYGRALEIEPRNALALGDRALALAALGDLDAATRDLDAVRDIDPRNKIMFHGRGMVAQRQSDWPAAVEAFSEAIAIDPKNSWALQQRANAYAADGRLEEALADATRLLELNPKQRESRMQRISMLRLLDRQEDALAEARAIETDNPDDFGAILSSAVALGEINATEEADAAFDRAFEMQPVAFIHVMRATFRPKSDREGRMASLEAALEMEPTMTLAVTGKADLLVEAGDLRGAIKVYSDALAKSPYDYVLLNARGIAYLKSGDAKRAKADFDAAREEADDAGKLNNLCWNKATAGVALEAALAECDAALAKEPGSAALLDSRALVLLRLGRNDDAIAAYSAALGRVGQLPSSLYGRSIAWSRKGDEARSRADRQAALAFSMNVQKQFEDYGVTK